MATSERASGCGRPVAGQGRPSPPTILSQAYIYYETPTYIYIYVYTVTQSVRARAHLYSHAHALARAESTRAGNYDFDALHLVAIRCIWHAGKKCTPYQFAKHSRAPSEVLTEPSHYRVTRKIAPLADSAIDQTPRRFLSRKFYL